MFFESVYILISKLPYLWVLIPMVTTENHDAYDAKTAHLANPSVRFYKLFLPYYFFSIFCICSSSSCSIVWEKPS